MPRITDDRDAEARAGAHIRKARVLRAQWRHREAARHMGIGLRLRFAAIGHGALRRQPGTARFR